jgi:hypothetical protein
MKLGRTETGTDLDLCLDILRACETWEFPLNMETVLLFAKADVFGKQIEDSWEATREVFLALAKIGATSFEEFELDTKNWVLTMTPKVEYKTREPEEEHPQIDDGFSRT